MNRGLLLKSVREVWPATLLFGLALLAVEGLLNYVFPTFYDDFFEPALRMQFIQNLARGLLGTEALREIGPKTLSSVAWVHPLVLAIVWAHEITLCTRLPAGEVDRGTIDLLLGLPVSRWQLYLCESSVWLATGLVLTAAGVAGSLIGGLAIRPELRHEPGRLLVVILNFYCLYLAVGGLSWLVSAASDRRGRAVGVVFAVLLGSFLLNVLDQFWRPARAVSFLSVLHYYQPMAVLRDAAWPARDMLVLLSAGLLLWLAGGLLFSRRNICTV